MPFIYFRSLSAVVILIFIQAMEKMMRAYAHILYLSQLLIAENRSQGTYKYIKVACSYFIIISAVKQCGFTACGRQQ